MNFFHYISSKSYTTTNIKIFNDNNKNIIYFTIVIYLIISPYLSLEISKFLIIILEFFSIMIFKGIYLNHTLTIIKNVIIFYSHTLILNHYNSEQYYLINKIKRLKISFIYYCKIKEIVSTNQISIYMLFYYAYYYIPRYINKIILLSVLYLLSMYKTSFFIKSETIGLNIFRVYAKIKDLQQYKIPLYKNNYLDILFSHHILEKIIENFHYIHLNIKSKNTSINVNILKYIIIFIKNFYFSLLKYQHNFNISFYTRKIKMISDNKKYL